MDKTDYNTQPAKPATPLAPDELDEAVPASDMEKRGYYEDKPSLPEPGRARKAPEPEAHPTRALDVRTGQKSGPAEGKPRTHPTAELHVKPRGRR